MAVHFELLLTPLAGTCTDSFKSSSKGSVKGSVKGSLNKGSVVF